MGTRWRLPARGAGPARSPSPAWPGAAPHGVPAASTPGRASVPGAPSGVAGAPAQRPREAQHEPPLPQPAPGANSRLVGSSWGCGWCPGCGGQPRSEERTRPGEGKARPSRGCAGLAPKDAGVGGSRPDGWGEGRALARGGVSVPGVTGHTCVKGRCLWAARRVQGQRLPGLSDHVAERPAEADSLGPLSWGPGHLRGQLLLPEPDDPPQALGTQGVAVPEDMPGLPRRWAPRPPPRLLGSERSLAAESGGARGVSDIRDSAPVTGGSAQKQHGPTLSAASRGGHPRGPPSPLTTPHGHGRGRPPPAAGGKPRAVLSGSSGRVVLLLRTALQKALHAFSSGGKRRRLLDERDTFVRGEQPPREQGVSEGGGASLSPPGPRPRASCDHTRRPQQSGRPSPAAGVSAGAPAAGDSVGGTGGRGWGPQHAAPSGGASGRGSLGEAMTVGGGLLRSSGTRPNDRI